MKSSFVNMVVVLTAITLVASAAVGLVYKVTKEPIELAKQQNKVTALSQVLPEFNNSPNDEMKTVTVNNLPISIYPAKLNGDAVGYAVESITNSGFSGTIKIMVGFEANGNIRNIEVLEQNETPGLGAKLANADNPAKVSFVGNNPANLKMSVKKDGGDIDAITASTISSRAYVDAVNRAYNALQIYLGNAEESYDAAPVADKSADSASGATVSADSSSGATATATEEPAAKEKGRKGKRENKKNRRR